MLKFQETAKQVSAASFDSACSDAVVARRYSVERKLGRGSFGNVYLVSDRKAKQGEELKVLKEISVGGLKPNETVEANLEAQLLSKLDHPAIVKFYASFVERDSFCIVTEYCEGGDLDCKIQDYKESGKIFTEKQILDWFIQLVLGVNYMHERRILHRDLKAKNIFLKNDLLKIGDFGVSRLLMGSCELATTFTGTPHYMSPEALQHQGYDTKSDIWSLGCILYEMCCLTHAFAGHSFLSVVLKVVEGSSPSLPEPYPRQLNSLLCSMLSKNPALRPAAADILKSPYIEEQLKVCFISLWYIQGKFPARAVQDKALDWQKGAAPIPAAGPRKVHLQTLQELSEVQKMTPRERMRLRKFSAADEKAKKLKQLTEEKYQETRKRMQELRNRQGEQRRAGALQATHSSSLYAMNSSLPLEIPEDPETAEEYYKDEFESCSEGSEEEDVAGSETLCKAEQQVCGTPGEADSDIEEIVKCLENILESSLLGSRTVTRVSPGAPPGLGVFNSRMAETKLRHLRECAIGKLGAKAFEAVYSSLKQARQQNASEEQIRRDLEKLVARTGDCFEVDQLLYFEEQL
ncbi:NEK11 kinase, partial [Psilopogon haemacephalus]|nr:NEK11 kinase [Psilopogon haemacephalus]